MYIGGGGWVESKWPISCTFTAKATSSTIKIFASLNQGLTDEWFGIDKIDPLYETSCVAQPSSSCSGFRSVDMASDGKKVIAVGPIGIFQSLDGGVTWIAISSVYQELEKTNPSAIIELFELYSKLLLQISYNNLYCLAMGQLSQLCAK